MSAAVAERSGTVAERAGAARRPRTRHSAQRPHRDGEVARGGGSTRADDGMTPSTLAESLARAWEDLASRGRAECLVCGDALVARLEAAGAPGGDCAACGSALD